MTDSKQTLPVVQWGTQKISRLLLGHNPFKGTSHHTGSLDAEMKEWHSDPAHVLATLRRSEQCGINTAQFGGDVMHRALDAYRQEGGKMQWIATMYGNEKGDLGVGNQMGIKEELAAILAVDPKPIGIQHFGEKTDRLYFAGQLDIVRERLKVLRDTGLLVGLCTHLPHVAEEVESQGWDIDFYQTSFYTVYSKTGERAIDREHEVFNDPDRDSMVHFIQKVDKPCIAFKVLASNRKCDTDESVKSTLKFAFDHIKDTDVVCAGMWLKYKDQVQENAALVREILGQKR